MRKIYLGLFIGLCLSLSAQKADIKDTKPFSLGVIDHIKSESLGEDRVLNIYLPEGYDPNGKEVYPVIYLLDGSANEDFIHVCGVVQFLTQIVDSLPKAIVVGIANVDRQRDFTYSPAADDVFKIPMPTAGGSGKFISFLEKELLPYIQKKYRGTGSQTLIGQSLGGLVATEILIKQTDLFDNYLIVSPSLWWHKEEMLKGAVQSGFRMRKPASLCVAVGGREETVMQEDAKELLSTFNEFAGKGARAYLLPMPGENHLTILHNAVYLGLPILLHKTKK